MTSQAPVFAESSECFQCKTSFGAFTRRHHCRNCGKSFCSNCQTKKMPMLHYGYEKPERVCDPCFIELNKKMDGGKEYIPRFVTSERNKELLKTLPDPKLVWDIFLRLTEIPRGSNNQVGIRKNLMELSTKLGLQAEEDTDGNVLIRRPASKGSENKEYVGMQARDDKKIDFLTEPIEAQIVGDYLKASDTSLGADNGIGIAMGLAILIEDIPHPPLELLCTFDEEIGLIGAFALKGGWLKSKIMINIDSEEENAVCVGCAGGYICKANLPLDFSDVDKTQYTPVKMEISGCAGGHSGIDIEKNHCNAINLMARLLKSMFVKDIKFRIGHFKGGTAHNAIPRGSISQLWVPIAQLQQFLDLAASTFNDYKTEFKLIEKTMKIDIVPIESEIVTAASYEKSHDLTKVITLLPNGPIRMSSEVDGLVETSSIVALSNIEEGNLDILISARSSSGLQNHETYLKAQGIMNIAGGKISEKQQSYPGWMPDLSSNIVKLFQKKFQEVTSIEPKAYAVHAGLECGLIQALYPGMECVSIGPEIHFPHSPDEELLISSVTRVYNVLRSSITELA